MEELNHSLFEAINATEASDPLWIAVGQFCAVYLIYLVPIILVVGWLAGGDRLRRILLGTFFAIVVALGISTIIGTLWPQPRPFVVPIGQTFLDYDATPAFPSNHATIMLTMALGLLFRQPTRWPGAVFLAITIPVLWARIYVGVHFPLDMAGAIVLSLVCAGGVARWHQLLVDPVYDRLVHPLFAWLFAPLIKRGWVKG